MHVTEEGRVACDLRYTAFARSEQQRRAAGTTMASLRTRGHSARDATSDAEEREASGVLVSALEPCVRLETIPKSIVDLDVLVLEDDGSALAAAVAAASVALADAGVEMRDLAAACVVAKLPGAGGGLVVDPTAEEERAAVGGLLVSVMPSLNEITQLVQFGELHQNDITDAIELCLDASSRLYATMRRVLLSAAQQQPQQ